MKITARAFYCIFLFSLVCVGGCSPQKTLAQRLRGADRVIVTNSHRGTSITVTGKEVDKLVKAIAAGKEESPLIKAAVGLRLDFYKGTEQLETVITSYEVFWVGKTPYSDTTETLKGIYQRTP